MKKLVAFVVLSTALAIACTRCAHERLTQPRGAIHRNVLVGETIVGAMIVVQTR